MASQHTLGGNAQPITPNTLGLAAGLNRVRSKRHAIPPEKGAWVWWIGPLLVGGAAAGTFSLPLLALVLAATAGFLLKQPVTLLAKHAFRGYGREDRGPALFWAAAYGVVLAVSVSYLLALEHYWVLPMGAAAAALFAWHLVLIAGKSERHQTLRDVSAAGVLALAAPAAYWSAGGAGSVLPWALWLVCALQSSASIVHMMLRLEQRRLKALPDLRARLRMGVIPLLHHAGNVLVAALLSYGGLLPWWGAAALCLPLVEGIQTVVRPPVGARLPRIGYRQLAVSSGFFFVLMLGVLR